MTSSVKTADRMVWSLGRPRSSSCTRLSSSSQYGRTRSTALRHSGSMERDSKRFKRVLYLRFNTCRSGEMVEAVRLHDHIGPRCKGSCTAHRWDSEVSSREKQSHCHVQGSICYFHRDGGPVLGQTGGTGKSALAEEFKWYSNARVKNGTTTVVRLCSHSQYSADWSVES